MASKHDDSTSNAGNTLSMKLLVDTKARRVLYAEAGKDVVDFLFSLLALPIGTVAKLAADGPMTGSVCNLYGSVRGLDARYVACTSVARNPLLSRTDAHVHGLLPDDGEEAPPTTKTSRCIFFRCSEQYYQDCCEYIAEASGTPCPVCSYEMSSQLEIVRKEPVSCHCSGCGDGGFVRDTVTYTIKDDLSVAPMSTISGICLLSASGVTSIGALEEKTVPLSFKEGLEILKASLHSKTVLTDAFLGNVAQKEQIQN